MEFCYRDCQEDGWGWNEKVYPNWNAGGIGPAIQELTILAGYPTKIPDSLKQALQEKGLHVVAEDLSLHQPDKDKLKKNKDILLVLVETYYGSREWIDPKIGPKLADRIESLLTKFPKESYNRWAFGQLVIMLRDAAKKKRRVMLL